MPSFVVAFILAMINASTAVLADDWNRGTYYILCIILLMRLYEWAEGGER